MCVNVFFFVKQKTAYEMRISDWSSDVFSSDLDATFQYRHFHVCPFIQGSKPAALSATWHAVHQVAQGQRNHRKISNQHQAGHDDSHERQQKIGRASCRERVSVRVDLGGRRIIKKKKHKRINNKQYYPPP